jgi:hypothetical protein
VLPAPREYLNLNVNEVASMIVVKTLDWGVSTEGEWELCVGYHLQTSREVGAAVSSSPPPLGGANTSNSSSGGGHNDLEHEHSLKENNKKVKPVLIIKNKGFIACWNLVDSACLWHKRCVCVCVRVYIFFFFA